MANEFGIADAKIIAKRLAEEIKTSSDNTQEKEDLVSMINMLINMPNLLKEKLAIEGAIGKNRDKLTKFENDVKREEEETAVILARLRQHVLDSETHASEIEKSNSAEIKQMQIEHGDILSEERNKAKAQIDSIHKGVEDETARAALVRTELGKMEAKLNAFKDTVAGM